MQEIKFNPESLGFKTGAVITEFDEIFKNSKDFKPHNYTEYYLELSKYKGKLHISTFDYFHFDFAYNSPNSSIYDRPTIDIEFEARNHEIGEAIVKSLLASIDDLNLRIEKGVLKVQNKPCLFAEITKYMPTKA